MAAGNRRKIQRVAKGQQITAAKANEVIDAINNIIGVRGGKNINVTQTREGEWVVSAEDKQTRIDWFYAQVTEFGPTDDPLTTAANSSRVCTEDEAGKPDFTDERYWVKKMYVDNDSTSDLDANVTFSFPDCNDPRFLHVVAHNIDEWADGTHNLEIGHVVRVWEIQDDGNRPRYLFGAGSDTLPIAEGDEWIRIIQQYADEDTPLIINHATACQYASTSTVNSTMDVDVNGNNVTVTPKTISHDSAGHFCTITDGTPEYFYLQGGSSSTTIINNTQVVNFDRDGVCLGYQVTGQTTDATPTCLAPLGDLPPNATWFIRGSIVARNNEGNKSFAAKFDAVAEDIWGATSITYSLVNELVDEIGISLSVTASNNKVCIQATGPSDSTVCYDGCLDITQVVCSYVSPAPAEPDSSPAAAVAKCYRVYWTVFQNGQWIEASSSDLVCGYLGAGITVNQWFRDGWILQPDANDNLSLVDGTTTDSYICWYTYIEEGTECNPDNPDPDLGYTMGCPSDNFPSTAGLDCFLWSSPSPQAAPAPVADSSPVPQPQPSPTGLVYTDNNNSPLPCFGDCPSEAEAIAECPETLTLIVSGASGDEAAANGTWTLTRGKLASIQYNDNQWASDNIPDIGGEHYIQCNPSGNWKFSAGTVWGAVERQSTDICPPNGSFEYESGSAADPTAWTVTLSGSSGEGC